MSVYDPADDYLPACRITAERDIYLADQRIPGSWIKGGSLTITPGRVPGDVNEVSLTLVVGDVQVRDAT